LFVCSLGFDIQKKEKGRARQSGTAWHWSGERSCSAQYLTMAPPADSACTNWRHGPVSGQNAVTIHRRAIGALWIFAVKRHRSARHMVAAILIAGPSAAASTPQK
jgi:hypothetical protein